MALSDNHISELAGLALHEIEVQADKRVEGDQQAWAERYVTEAYDELRTLRGGYDPETEASGAAERAAVEYVKARLTGQSPTGTSSFELAARRWQRRAAINYHQAELEKEEDEDAPASRFDR